MTSWLPAVLEAAGLDPSVQGVRGRPGDYEPHGVLIHHTATRTTKDDPLRSLALVKKGRSDLPGPLCQLLIGVNGEVAIVTTGRANHAGNARESGPMPAGNGNELYVGIEIDYSGYEAPSTAQYQAAVTATAAILNRLKRTSGYARGHRETSVTGKWDPGQVDMDRFRADVAARQRLLIAPPVVVKPEPVPEKKKVPTMFVAKHGSSRYRLITGDQLVPITVALALELQKQGVPLVAVGETDYQALAQSLVSEKTVVTLVDESPDPA